MYSTQVFPSFWCTMSVTLTFRLRDSSCLVRKNTIMVLTHLILNDMVKVKGQISELAICIVDDNELIANRAQLFFSELSKKVSKSSFLLQMRALYCSFYLPPPFPPTFPPLMAGLRPFHD